MLSFFVVVLVASVAEVIANFGKNFVFIMRNLYNVFKVCFTFVFFAFAFANLSCFSNSAVSIFDFDFGCCFYSFLPPVSNFVSSSESESECTDSKPETETETNSDLQGSCFVSDDYGCSGSDFGPDFGPDFGSDFVTDTDTDSDFLNDSLFDDVNNNNNDNNNNNNNNDDNELDKSKVKINDKKYDIDTPSVNVFSNFHKKRSMYFTTTTTTKSKSKSECEPDSLFEKMSKIKNDYFVTRSFYNNFFGDTISLKGLEFKFDRESESYKLTNRFYDSIDLICICETFFREIESINCRGYVRLSTLDNSFITDITNHLHQLGYKTKI